jgi:Protein of unknown function (DUF4232)
VNRANVARLAAIAASALIAITAIFLAVPAVAGTLPPPCTARHLTLTVTGDGAAAGSSFYSLNFAATRDCYLYGYPGASFRDAAGHRIGRAAARDTTVTPEPVALRPGHPATAMLQVISAGVYPPGVCRPVSSARIRVYVPGEFSFKSRPFRLDACTRRMRASQLIVRPVTGGGGR